MGDERLDQVGQVDDRSLTVLPRPPT